MSQGGSWRRSTWTPPKPFKSSVISKQAGRWEFTGAPFNSPTRRARLPDWHLSRLSQRLLSHLIVFLPLNLEKFTTFGEMQIKVNSNPADDSPTVSRWFCPVCSRMLTKCLPLRRISALVQSALKKQSANPKLVNDSRLHRAVSLNGATAPQGRKGEGR